MLPGRLGCVLVILFVGFAGCLGGTTSPIGAAPSLLLDHIDESSDTQIIVQGIEDHLYSNITLEINGEIHTEEFTYVLAIRTNSEKIRLIALVWDKEQPYSYAANFTLQFEGDKPIVLVEITGSDTITEEDLPFRAIMEKGERV